MIMLPLRAKVWSLVVVLTAALVPEGAFAQTTTVTCLSSFGWMNNSLEQNPCLVSAYLVPREQTIANVIHYCQNNSYMSFPLDIPSGTKVPNWAYLNLTNGQFDPTVAQINGDLPESTATGVPSTATVIHSTTLPASLTTLYTSSTTTTGPSTTSSSLSSNVGAIAGGVIGGIAGAAVIIGLATWYFVKRRRSSTALSAGFNNVGGSPGWTQSFYSTNTIISPMAQQPRLYDPSDPTTFPVHPHSSTGLVTSASSNIALNSSLPPSSFLRQSYLGQYTGVPQV
ncbi:hypothetical protein BDR04DRAFT_1112202 [Suillus decipiens]|nr:hypothetical protein BDR04DRAFT_1112202 [Suillus decipiens]